MAATGVETLRGPAAVAGSRQDAGLEVAAVIYMMRRLYVEYLSSDMKVGDNITSSRTACMYVQLTSPVLVAAPIVARKGCCRLVPGLAADGC